MEHNKPHIHHHLQLRIKEIVIPVLVFSILIALLSGAIGFTFGYFMGLKQTQFEILQHLKNPDSIIQTQ